tara:strand:+ start:5484 stop:7421 length:1938 start_codon:yes stop_codon:yes gene_type:complete
MSAYGTYDRMARYSDFSEMEYTPEIASALDIYAEESAATDENGHVLHVHSENPKIKQLLEDLFLDTINIEFNLTSWVRNLCKYGDFFLFNDLSPDHGIINVLPIPVNEIEREEGFDPQDPMAVRYRWVTQGNQVLENWQITHFRLLGNDAFLPYGSSVLESARRIWRQLILVEDAMLVYRVVRSPERRVFKIDVGNVPPEDIPNYMEQVQSTLKRAQVVDKNTGRVDLRYNPLSVDEDYYLPVRGSESGTSIDTLAGGQNATAIEDVEYIQKKLFAALKIPKAYLGYDEGLGAKATLAQEDIRFSRAINKIQRTLISELNKIAIIHLYSYGFEGEDLLDFSLQLSNPSTVAQQQKLELFRSRFEIAGGAPEGMVDRNFLRKTILGLTDKQIEEIEKGKLEDKLIDLKIEEAKLPEGGEAGGDEGGAPEDDMGPEEEMAGDNRNTNNLPIISTEVSPYSTPVSESDDDFDNIVKFKLNDESAPIRAADKIKKYSAILSEGSSEGDDCDEEEDEESYEYSPEERERRNRNRRVKNTVTAMGDRGLFPDLSKMTSIDTKRGSNTGDPFGMQAHRRDFLIDPNPLSEDLSNKNEDDQGDFFENFINRKITQQSRMTSDISSTLKSLESRINISNSSILAESIEEDEEID